MWLEGVGDLVVLHPARTDLMKDELSEALEEALLELDLMPLDEEAALVGVHAVMDDLQRAMERASRWDRGGRT
jgi:hypothetical protein